MEHLFDELRSLTLSKPSGPFGWGPVKLVKFLQVSAPLKHLHLYDEGLPLASIEPTQSHFFQEDLRAIISICGPYMETLSLLRMSVTSEMLREIAKGFPNLRKLFFSWVVSKGASSVRV